MIDLQIGEELKQVRKAIKMRSTRLGELCEVGYSHISRIESGNINSPSYILINKAIIGMTNEIITMTKVDREKAILKLNNILEKYNNSILEHILYRLRSRDIKYDILESDVLYKTKETIDRLKVVRDILDINIEDLNNIYMT